MVELIEIGVLAALGAWILTQFHLLFVVKRIKKDIDTKRAATEVFVSAELDKLEAAIGGFEARVHAEMPPNVHGEIESVRAEIEEFNVGLRKEFESLPERIRFTLVQEEGRQAQHMMSAAKDMNENLRTELAAVNAQIPPELQGDIRGKILKAISREPTKKERDSMGMVGELIWNFGRMKAAEYLQGEGPPGTSVTYRVTKGSQEF